MYIGYIYTSIYTSTYRKFHLRYFQRYNFAEIKFGSISKLKNLMLKIFLFIVNLF